jgi:hypothetical protein
VKAARHGGTTSMVNSLRSVAKGLSVVALLAVAVIFPSTASAVNTFYTNTQPVQTQEVGPTGVTLRGVISNTQVETTYWFEYGPTTAYGTKTPVETLTKKYPELTFVKLQLNKEWEPGTTFHFRMIATDSENTDVGDDKTFVTHAITAENPPEYLYGTLATSTKAHIGIYNGESLDCDSSAVYAPTAVTLPLSFLAEQSLTNCHVGAGPKLPIAANGCQFQFKISQNVVGTTGAMDIVNCKPEMTLNGYSGFCWSGGFQIPSQNGLGVTYSTEGSGSARVLVAKVVTTKLKHSCSGTSYSNGVFEATWRIGAYYGAGTQIGLFVK